MKPFEPEQFGFVRIDYAPSGIAFYEYGDHTVVDGRTDVMRINIYMSRDGHFTCIWNGHIEPTMTQSMFKLPSPADDLDFTQIYCEQLFRGYIASEEEATVILSALRIVHAAKSLPQVLRGAPDDLRCETP